MNKSEIGIQELREKLATQVMGWRLGTEESGILGNDRKAWLLKLPQYENEQVIIYAKQWQPDIDRDQTALLLEKVAGLGRQDEFIEELARQQMPEDFPKDRESDGLISTWEAFELLYAGPEAICRAILEVISQEPTQ